MHCGFYIETFSIIFYDSIDRDTVVTPSAGTITITGSETGEQYAEVSSFEADTAGATSTYTRPAFAGSVTRININLVSIAGATHFTATLDRAFGS